MSGTGIIETIKAKGFLEKREMEILSLRANGAGKGDLLEKFGMSMDGLELAIAGIQQKLKNNLSPQELQAYAELMTEQKRLRSERAGQAQDQFRQQIKQNRKRLAEEEMDRFSGRVSWHKHRQEDTEIKNSCPRCGQEVGATESLLVCPTCGYMDKRKSVDKY